MNYKIALADTILQLSTNDKIYFDQLKENYIQTKIRKPPSFTIEIIKTNNKKAVLFKINKRNKGTIYLGLKKKGFSFQAINFFIKSFIQYFCLTYDIFILHASSLRIGSLAYVFMGRAGAGKSTVLGFATENQQLADDTTVIKKMNKSYYVFSSPFDKKKCPYIKFAKSKLKNIFALEKSPKTEIARFINKNKGCEELFLNNFFYLFLKRIKKNIKFPIFLNTENHLQSCLKGLNRKIPVARLLFQKNDLFFRLIKKA